MSFISKLKEKFFAKIFEKSNHDKTLEEYDEEIKHMVDIPDTSVLDAIRTTLKEEEQLKLIREELKRNSTASRRNGASKKNN